jgi:DNA polymerase
MVVRMSVLWLDTETRSRVDLISRGSYNYAQDPSTSLLCLSYAFDDEEVKTWIPDQPFPQRVANHFANGGRIYVHNAAFDRLILWYVVCPEFDVPEPRLEQFYCTATQARANCAPGSLEDVGRFASADMRKDYRGAQLIRRLCMPQADGKFCQDAALFAEMVAYCEQDVRAMRAISKAMRDLSAEELADYHVNERINDRGVLVDVALCKAAIEYASDELVEIEQLVAEVTQGEIMSVRSPKMRQWVMDRVGPEALKLMESYKDGEKKYSIDKTVRANLLAMDDPEQVPPDVADVIQCADDLWASSVAKFARLAALADDEDHRVRGVFVFAGGSATGRASSYGAQLHNFTRKCADDPEAVRHAMVRGHKIVPTYGRRVTDVLKGMLRPALMPAPEHVLIVADWAAIEARMNPWLSAHVTSEAKLDLFRTGADIYKHNASRTFNVPIEQIDKEQRQIGKVQELACGYGGGVGAFASMGRIYGVNLPEADSRRMVDAWRRANPWAVHYWQALESGYLRAMKHPKSEFKAGRVTYYFDGQHLWYALPSGRILCYPYARLEDDGVSYAKASWKPAADAKEWPRARLWKGLAAENICQAAANDILRSSLRQLDGVVLHVHDEIVLEVPASDADAAVTMLHSVMCTSPAWASGLPLEAEINVMTRYGK